jgi:hypothetical protein
MDEELIIEVWEIFRDHVPEKTRAAAAEQFIDFLVDKDTDTDVLEGLKGYDPHLDDAIDLVLGDEEESDEDEDDGWGEEEDDEDY